ALGRRHVIGRIAVVPFILLLAILLNCFATRTPTPRIFSAILFEELQMLIAVATLLLFRCQGFRIGTVPTGSPFAEPNEESSNSIWNDR
ncbi:MAG TPA: hypothetical protein VFI31_03330, partial [Pirellulales bacterium]|nr:hypothetical protein [Pirellulales bacterium]